MQTHLSFGKMPSTQHPFTGSDNNPWPDSDGAPFGSID